MPDFTPGGIQFPLAEDKIKDGTSPSALADNFKTLALTADAHGNDAANAAQAAAEMAAATDATTKANAAEVAARWWKPGVADGTDFNTFTAPGVYPITTSAPNMPDDKIGTLSVEPLGATVLQRFTTWETVPRTFVRQRDTGGSWFPWAPTWNAGTVSASVNVNTLTTPGVYNVPSGNAVNLPIAALGSLEVIPTSTALVQKYTAWALPVRMFTRRQSGGVWAAWKELGVEWGKGNVSSAIDVGTLTTPGAYSITSSSNGGLPVPYIGSLEVLQVSAALLQRFTTWEHVPRTWERRQMTNGTWDEWKRKGSRQASSSFKAVPLALTLPGTTVTDAITSQSVRWPIRYAVPLNRWRLHIRNANYANNSIQAGAISVNGIWVGPGAGGVFAGAPLNVHGAFTTPADGSEYVSAWITSEIPQDTDYMVSIGFTAASGQEVAITQGGCWRTATSTDASLASPAAVKHLTSPFDVWIEAEVPAATPLLGGFGDSMTVGTNSTLPVFDSWLSMYCRDMGALPYLLAQHGSAAANWTDGNHNKWHRFDAVTKPDAVIDFLGQNDLAEGVTLATMQSRFASVVAVVAEQLSSTVYAATLTPAAAKSGAINDVRIAYNSWLGTLPGGVRDCLDFAAIVSTPEGVMKPEFDADGIHLNTAGNAALADYVKTRRVTPEVLTPGQIVSLKALL